MPLSPVTLKRMVVVAAVWFRWIVALVIWVAVMFPLIESCTVWSLSTVTGMVLGAEVGVGIGVGAMVGLIVGVGVVADLVGVGIEVGVGAGVGEGFSIT